MRLAGYLVLFALVLTVSAPVSAGTITIKFSHVVAEDTPKGKAAIFFKELLEKKSGGRIKVSVYPNSQLFKDNEAVTALLMGSVQLIAPSTSKLTTLVPEFQIVDLPYLFPTLNGVHRAFDGKLGRKLNKLLAKKGFKSLAYWDNGYKQLGNNKRSIKIPKDAAGLKFRIMSSKVLENQFKHIGANPQVMAFSEVYTALEQGVIDGQENTWSNSYSQKFHEVQSHMTNTDHGYLGYVLLTSAIFWNSLPADLQTVFSETVKETTDYERKIAFEINERDRERILKFGKTKVISLSESERKLWIETFQPFLGSYKKWQGLIDAARNP